MYCTIKVRTYQVWLKQTHKSKAHRLPRYAHLYIRMYIHEVCMYHLDLDQQLTRRDSPVYWGYCCCPDLRFAGSCVQVVLRDLRISVYLICPAAHRKMGPMSSSDNGNNTITPLPLSLQKTRQRSWMAMLGITSHGLGKAWRREGVKASPQTGWARRIYASIICRPRRALRGDSDRYCSIFASTCSRAVYLAMVQIPSVVSILHP